MELIRKMAIPATSVRITVLFLIIVAYILCIIATTTNYWMESPFTNVGIWKMCTKKSGSCQDLIPDTNLNDTGRTIQALMIISCLGYGLVLVLFVLRHFKDIINAKIIAGVLIFIVVCEVMAMSLFINENTDMIANEKYSIKYGYSFGMGWTAPIFTGIAVSLFLFWFKREQNASNRERTST